MDPVGFLNAELDALLHRLIETDVTKWQALRTLGLGAVPAAGKGGETV